MIASISASTISKLSPKDKPYDVRDERLSGFILRVNCSGKMMYMCEYARGKRISIGKADVLSPAQARDKAKEMLADAVRGVEPHNKKPQKVSTFASYIESNYKTWVEANRKSGRASVARIKTQFLKILGDKSLSQITPWLLEQWRTQRLKEGVKPSTINRDLIALKSAFSKAVEWELIDAHPLAKLKLSKVDTHSKIRYLSKEEEERCSGNLEMSPLSNLEMSSFDLKLSSLKRRFNCEVKSNEKRAIQHEAKRSRTDQHYRSSDSQTDQAA